MMFAPRLTYPETDPGPESRQTLARLASARRIAVLATLREDAPFVSLVPFVLAPEPPVSLHIQDWHTRDPPSRRTGLPDDRGNLNGRGDR